MRETTSIELTTITGVVRKNSTRKRMTFTKKERTYHHSDEWLRFCLPGAQDGRSARKANDEHYLNDILMLDDHIDATCSCY